MAKFRQIWSHCNQPISSLDLKIPFLLAIIRAKEKLGHHKLLFMIPPIFSLLYR